MPAADAARRLRTLCQQREGRLPATSYITFVGGSLPLTRAHLRCVPAALIPGAQGGPTMGLPLCWRAEKKGR